MSKYAQIVLAVVNINIGNVQGAAKSCCERQRDKKRLGHMQCAFVLVNTVCISRVFFSAMLSTIFNLSTHSERGIAQFGIFFICTNKQKSSWSSTSGVGQTQLRFNSPFLTSVNKYANRDAICTIFTVIAFIHRTQICNTNRRKNTVYASKIQLILPFFLLLLSWLFFCTFSVNVEIEKNVFPSLFH